MEEGAQQPPTVQISSLPLGFHNRFAKMLSIFGRKHSHGENSMVIKYNDQYYYTRMDQLESIQPIQDAMTAAGNMNSAVNYRDRAGEAAKLGRITAENINELIRKFDYQPLEQAEVDKVKAAVDFD